MDQPFLGAVALFGFNFAPKGWAFCNGQLLSISQYAALYSLLGSTYGGNGQTTFALPDLRGRVPIGFGQGPGTSNHVLGEMAGTENVTLISSQIPAHTHPLLACSDTGTVSSPQGAFMANSGGTDPEYRTSGNLTMMNPQAIGLTGSNMSHNNMQPYLCMNYCIALIGIFPSHS